MKKILSLIAFIILISANAMAANHYGATSLIGGGAGALDALDITGASTPNADNLADGDSAIVTTISGTTVLAYWYIFDADGTTAESSPTVIRPDDYATQGVWRLVVFNANAIPDISATYQPLISFGAGTEAALGNAPDAAGGFQSVLAEGAFVAGDKTKLDGIETAADVTDATNVAAAGALMDSDTDNIDDTHINWGDAAGQVGHADITLLYGSGSCSGYLKSDGTCDTPAGGGNVTASGTPAQYEFAEWVDSTHVKGTAVTGSKVVCTDANGSPTACTNLVDDADLATYAGITPSAQAQAFLVDGNYTAAAVDWVLSSLNSLAVPNGANPTTNAAGEIAVDSSAGAGQGVRAYAAAAFTLPAWQAKCTTIAGATASSDYPVEQLPYAVTVQQARVTQRGATNVVGHFDECDSAGASCAGIDGATDITAATTATDDGTLSNPTIDANDVIQWHTTSVSGTNTDLIVCIYYTVDQVN